MEVPAVQTQVSSFVASNAATVQLVKLDKANCMCVLRIRNVRIEVTVPPDDASAADTVFLVLQPAWLAEKAAHRAFRTFAAVGEWALKAVEEGPSKKKAPKRAKSSDADVDNDDDDDDDDFGDDSDDLASSQASAASMGHLSLSASTGGVLGAEADVLGPELCATLEHAIQQANECVGTKVFALSKDLGVVKMTFALQDVGCDEKFVESVGQTMDQKVCAHLSYVTRDGVPKLTVTLLKDKLNKKDRDFALWLTDIGRHVINIWFTGDREELRHFGVPKDYDMKKALYKASTSAVKGAAVPVATQQQKQVQKGNSKVKKGSELLLESFSSVFGGKKKDLRVDSQALEEELDDTKLDVTAVTKYYWHGGFSWHAEPNLGEDDLQSSVGGLAKTSSTVSAKDDALSQLVAMGFNVFDAAMAIRGSSNLEHCALELSEGTHTAHAPDNAEALLKQLMLRGYTRFDAAVVLLESNFSPPSTPVREISLSGAQDDNFFLRLLEFFAARLSRYQAFCISCHEAHNCLNPGAVVCAKPLCVFRWEEFKLDEVLPCHLCPFENCGCTNWPVKVMQRFGKSLPELSKEYGLDQTLLMELCFNKYLDVDEMQKLLQALKSVSGKKIRYCANPALCARFERKRMDMRDAGRTAEECKSFVAYHGTSEQNVDKIVETGFLLSKLAANTGNKGFYGAGIYCSPQIGYTVGYTRGGKKLIVCAVLMGKRYACKGIEMGISLKSGCDSHTDPSGNAEWVLFDEAQILPCALIELP